MQVPGHASAVSQHDICDFVQLWLPWRRCWQKWSLLWPLPKKLPQQRTRGIVLFPVLASIPVVHAPYSSEALLTCM